MNSVIHNLKFSEQALNLFASQITEFGTIETGGILMGYLEEGILHVEKASEPGPNAIHDPVYFRADANYIDMFIDMEFANSGGKNYYLGEWHTHPQVEPEPSDVDYNSLYEIANSAEEFAILLIVGAIKFSKEKFYNQHIAILKYKDDRRFYQVLTNM
ncbi:MAG TPA: Mov34/MPN/PAD-1 family protein [Flavisolibacter sp.]|nr:Mov34/MPN/PAD-1 family protein [Flavisolibacter sp.]